MLRKMILLALALLAARMAARAVRRDAEVIGLLWTLIHMTAASGTAGTPKSRNVEDRLNIAMPRIPWPQTSPGNATNTSNTISSGTNGIGAADNGGGTSNNSAGSVGAADNGGGTSNNSAGGTGGADNGGLTSGQIGSASPHNHDMSHAHAGGNHQHSMVHQHPGGNHQHSMVHGHAYGTLATDFNNLRSSHTSLVASHNTLITKLASANILQ